MIRILFFFNDTATTEIYTLSLHDALPISRYCPKRGTSNAPSVDLAGVRRAKWTEKPTFDDPQGYAAGASEAFRTVSQKRLEIPNSPKPGTSMSRQDGQKGLFCRRT